MVLEGVNLDENGAPTLWKVENSWGKDAGVDERRHHGEDDHRRHAHVRNPAEQPRAAPRCHGVLPDQLAQVAVGLEYARSHTALHQGLELRYDPRHKGGQGDQEDRLEQFYSDLGERHRSLTAMRATTSVIRMYPR